MAGYSKPVSPPATWSGTLHVFSTGLYHSAAWVDQDLDHCCHYTPHWHRLINQTEGPILFSMGAATIPPQGRRTNAPPLPSYVVYAHPLPLLRQCWKVGLESWALRSVRWVSQAHYRHLVSFPRTTVPKLPLFTVPLQSPDIFSTAPLQLHCCVSLLKLKLSCSTPVSSVQCRSTLWHTIWESQPWANSDGSASVIAVSVAFPAHRNVLPCPVSPHPPSPLPRKSPALANLAGTGVAYWQLDLVLLCQHSYLCTDTGRLALVLMCFMAHARQYLADASSLRQLKAGVGLSCHYHFNISPLPFCLSSASVSSLLQLLSSYHTTTAFSPFPI